jgi:hypothetical protein
MKSVCVAAGVADVDNAPVDFPDVLEEVEYEEEMLEKAFLRGNGTNADSLEESRDLLETLEVVLETEEDATLEEVEDMDD